MTNHCSHLSSFPKRAFHFKQVVGLLALLFGTLILVGCSPRAGSVTPQPSILFPYQEVGEGQVQVFLTAERVGTLTLDGKCLYLQAESDGRKLLLIWPPGIFSWWASGETIQILDQAGQVVAQVGDRVMIGGGEFTQSGSPAYYAQLQQTIPSCPGPFWRVGNSLVRMD